MSRDEPIAVVDDQNRFQRWAPRHEIHEQRLVHRSVHVLVFDPEGRLLIQRRHRDKQTWPRYWDISCAGHVAAEDYHAGPDEGLDRVYRLAAEREVAEEVGVTAPLEELAHFSPTLGVHYEQVRLYRVTWDGPVVIQEAEVEEVRWVTPAALDAMIADPDEPVTDALRWLSAWAREAARWPGL